MSEGRRLKVLSIAHTAVSRDIGRLRYHPLASYADLDVHLVAPRSWHEFGRSMLADPPDDPGLSMHIEPVRFTYLPHINWYLHHYPGMRRLLQTIEPDVVHMWEEPWSLVAWLTARQIGNAALVMEVDQNIAKRLPPPFESMRRGVLKRTTLVLARSPEAGAVVRSCGYVGPIMPIGYGVDQRVFHPSQSTPPAELAPGAPLRLAYVGRLIEEKGLDDVLDAMRQTRADVRLSLMGQGPHERALRARIKALGLAGRVSMRGWGAPDEVAEFMRAAHVSLLLTRTTPHVREQFGRAIIESQSCGVPVIGSTCGAIPDIVAAGGWIVPERDPASLASLLDAIAGRPEEIAGRAAAGLANVAARFTFGQVAAALAAAWRQADELRRAR